MNFRSFLIVYVAAVGALAKPDKVSIKDPFFFIYIEEFLLQFPPQEVFEIIDPLHELCTHKMGVSDGKAFFASPRPFFAPCLFQRKSRTTTSKTTPRRWCAIWNVSSRNRNGWGPRAKIMTLITQTSLPQMSEDGSIRFDFIREYVHPSVKQVVVTALDKCLVIEPGTKPCEKSYNFNVCMQAADPEVRMKTPTLIDTNFVLSSTTSWSETTLTPWRRPWNDTAMICNSF